MQPVQAIQTDTLSTTHHLYPLTQHPLMQSHAFIETFLHLLAFSLPCHAFEKFWHFIPFQKFYSYYFILVSFLSGFQQSSLRVLNTFSLSLSLSLIRFLLLCTRPLPHPHLGPRCGQILGHVLPRSLLPRAYGRHSKAPWLTDRA